MFTIQLILCPCYHNVFAVVLLSSYHTLHSQYFPAFSWLTNDYYFRTCVILLYLKNTEHIFPSHRMILWQTRTPICKNLQHFQQALQGAARDRITTDKYHVIVILASDAKTNLTKYITIYLIFILLYIKERCNSKEEIVSIWSCFFTGMLPSICQDLGKKKKN